MKDYIKEIIDSKKSLVENRNLLREYLQKYLLFLIYRNNFYKEIVFTGGTALRFLYGLKRFSEDLDFSLSTKGSYNFLKILEGLKKELSLAGYEIEITYNIEKNVHSAFIKILNLLYEFGLSKAKGEKFSVKIEIDTLPPAGGKEEVSFYNSVFMFEIKHFDLPSLFAGKLHAILCRKFNRGRDYYDLIWYLTKFKNLEPNIEMLKNAIKQTCYTKINLKDFNWRKILIWSIKEVNFELLRKDLLNLVEIPEEIALINKNNFLKLLKEREPKTIL